MAIACGPVIYNLPKSGLALRELHVLYVLMGGTTD